MDAYRSALEREIDDLRKQAVTLTARREALEHALALYDKTRSSRPSLSPPTVREGSQSASVLNRIRAAGADGITSAEIHQWINEQGLSIQPGTVRSLIYSKKKAGELERMPDGRYRLVTQAVYGAGPENDETAAGVTAAVSDESRENDLLG